MNQKPFGRRGQAPRPLPMKPIEAVVSGTGAVTPSAPIGPAERSLDWPLLPAEHSEPTSLDEELRRWKLARRQNFEIPWRPLSLLASLFFGVASFVLPDKVNDFVQWTLYALAAASFYVGVRHRRRAKT